MLDPKILTLVVVGIIALMGVSFSAGMHWERYDQFYKDMFEKRDSNEENH